MPAIETKHKNPFKIKINILSFYMRAETHLHEYESVSTNMFLLANTIFLKNILQLSAIFFLITIVNHDCWQIFAKIECMCI